MVVLYHEKVGAKASNRDRGSRYPDVLDCIRHIECDTTMTSIKDICLQFDAIYETFEVEEVQVLFNTHSELGYKI